jgi:DNA-binding NarL/FixJ family response regulator
MSNNLKVPLVDDNPMVLGMLPQSRSTLAEVKTAIDAPRDRLPKAVGNRLDLPVSDFRVPGIDGHQLIGKLESWPRAAAAVVLLATKTDISERKPTCTLNAQRLLMEGLRRLRAANRDAMESEDVLLDT